MPTVEEFRDFFLNEYEPASGPRSRRPTPSRATSSSGRPTLGGYRLTLPAEHGGWGLPVLEYLPYLEAAAHGPRLGPHARARHERRLAAAVQFGDAGPAGSIAGMGTGDVVLAFCLTEKTGGTGRDLQSGAERDGDDWLLTGEKHLITFADRADHFILVVATRRSARPRTP